MKTIIKPQILALLSLILFISLFAFMNSCKAPEEIAGKSGAQLWGENCVRCHNAPSPAIYSDAQWEVVGEHMRYKANLTDQEVKKVVEFLKSAN